MGPFGYLYRAKEHHYGTNNGSVVGPLRVRLGYTLQGRVPVIRCLEMFRNGSKHDIMWITSY